MLMSFCSKAYCHQKKKVRLYPAAYRLPSTNPGVHAFLSYFPHIDLQIPQTFELPINPFTNALQIRDTQEQQQNRPHNIPSQRHRQFTQMPAMELLTLHFLLCTFPESTSFLSIRC